MKGDHGKDSKYIHVRFRHPDEFSRMRTIDLGNGVKEVFGKTKGGKKWLPQNIMIPTSKISKHGSRIAVKSAKMREHLKKLNIKVSKIKRMKRRGENDYRCP